jgi:acetyltransferase-like isoleucine patch superfamily enzyme
MGAPDTGGPGPHHRDTGGDHADPAVDPIAGPGVDPTPDDVEAAAHDAHAAHVDAVVRTETAREGLRRAALLADDLLAEAEVPAHVRRPPLRLRYPRWGWREAVRVAVERRMVTPQYLNLYRRALWHRSRALATGNHVEFQGLTFTGKRVEFRARHGHGRLVIGPWCWIGNDNKLRAHEGQLTLGAKVVMGRDNVVNCYLDVEVGDASILADWIYVCDFDHRFERLDIAIKDQGIVTSPTRVGGDVWIGEKASVLRGVDIGQGAIVASHCLVNGDIPPFAIAVGVPARVVRSRLPAGMDPEEAAALLRAGRPIPADPLEG